jgi:hypothetical protein
MTTHTDFSALLRHVNSFMMLRPTCAGHRHGNARKDRIVAGVLHANSTVATIQSLLHFR